MPATVLYGILTFVLILGPLIILHELGHLIVARRMGVKTLEFGIGFPPRAAAIRWTGRTIVRLSPDTRYKFEDQRTHAQKGDHVTALYVRNSAGAAFAHTIRPVRNSDDSARAEGAQLIIGKVKEVSADEIVIADMLWSINWLPIGGFVRMVGEEDPAGEGSLASKGPWQRISVMGAGAAVNAVLPFLIFPVVLLIPQEQLAGDVIITRVMPGSPAEAAGIRDGDKVVKVDGRTIDQVGDLQQAVTLKLGAVSTCFEKPGSTTHWPGLRTRFTWWPALLIALVRFRLRMQEKSTQTFNLATCCKSRPPSVILVPKYLSPTRDGTTSTWVLTHLSRMAPSASR